MAKLHLLKIRTSIDIFGTESVKLLLALSIYWRFYCYYNAFTDHSEFESCSTHE